MRYAIWASTDMDMPPPAPSWPIAKALPFQANISPSRSSRCFLHKTARWRRLRKFQLIQHPLCKFYLERGIVTAANVVDHVEPHKGDWTEFVTGELQSLCATNRRSGSSSCAAIAVMSASTDARPIPTIRSTARAEIVMVVRREVYC